MSGSEDLIAGGAVLVRLKALGVDIVFVNSGTDFPPIIEGIAQAQAMGLELPEMVVVPHEHAAMGMAQGYYLRTGRTPAVMLHTNVGLANAATGVINAAMENVPMIIISGRTPVTESGRFGARTVPITWGQEMRDQTALVRESCKWDYELRFPEQIAGLLDRALAISNSTPKGPVYLSLPRETLCEPCPSENLMGAATIAPVTGAPDPEAVSKAAALLAVAKSPLVIAQRGVGDGESYGAFAQWVEVWGIAVCSWWATHLAISTEHPCHVGADPGPWLAKADVVLVLDCLAPWWPDKHVLADDVRVIHMGPDPLFSRTPVRNFRSDVSVAGENRLTVRALIAAMEGLAGDETAIAERRQRLAAATRESRKAMCGQARRENARGMTKGFVSMCLSDALEGIDACVFTELGTELGPLRRNAHSSWFQEPHSGGLGWSFPAALGAQLADREQVCVATMGDGCFMFANPTVCHQIAEALTLPILVLVLNNEEWGAVRASVTGMYPEGYAAKSNTAMLTALKPSPDFTRTAAASRAWSQTVSQASELPDALNAALAVMREEKRLALLDIKILPG